MTSNRLVVEVIARLIKRVDVLENQQTQVDDGLSGLDNQVKRLAKELYKSNLMNDDNASEDIHTLFQQLRKEYSQQQEKAVIQARLEVAKALLPVIDAVEAGLRSGVHQLRQLQQTSPESARTLYAWLNGQRLLRERLLKLLEVEGIQPIEALGQPFDPYRHVAVKVVCVADKPTDTIVKVERPGYIHGDDVLRFADVVVNKLN
jgi:molecular chaperone GrpE